MANNIKVADKVEDDIDIDAWSIAKLVLW